MPALLKSRRLWLLVAAAGGLAVLRFTSLADYLSLDTLRANRQDLAQFVHEHCIVAVVAYLAIYVVTTTFALPGAIFLTLAGGYLFGPKLGTLLTVIGATTGATLIFLFARALFGEHVLDRFGTKGARVSEYIRSHAWPYLLVLRVTPLFPFFLVNLISPFAGVDLRTYIVTTFFGIIPGAAVFSSYGAGIGSVLDKGQALSLKSILTPEIFVASIGLAFLVLLMIPVYRSFCSVLSGKNQKTGKVLTAGDASRADIR